MKLSTRRIAALALGSMLVAGCGGGDQAPHAVDQPDVTTTQSGKPRPSGSLDRSPGEQTTPEQVAEENQEENARARILDGSAPAVDLWRVDDAANRRRRADSDRPAIGAGTGQTAG